MSTSRFTSVLVLSVVAATQTPRTLTQRYDFEDASNRVSLRHRIDEASGLVDPETGFLILISARQESIIEITPGGRIVSGFHLGSDQHPQAEGIAILPDGTLLLADERQRGRAHLTAYVRLD
jgi:uncharacterized protein YjiK